MMEPMLQYPPSPASSDHPDQPHVYKVYRERWYALAIFCALEMANALLWVTFSPISDIAQHYFGSSTYYGSTTGVNMMANIFLILYTPGTIISVLSMKYLKPRKALLYAGLLTSIGALLRYLATLFDSSLTQEQVYILIFLGQCLSAIAQPMFLNFPPAIAGIWFPVDERDISTTIGSMSSPIGNAIGSVIPVLFVTEDQNSPGGKEIQNQTHKHIVELISYLSCAPDDDGNFTIKGMRELMLVEFLLCTIPLAIAFCYFKDAPPTPPSHSTQLKLEQQEQHLSGVRPSDRSLHTMPNHGSINSSAPGSASGSRHDEAQVLSEASSGSYESFSHTASAKMEFSPPHQHTKQTNHATINQQANSNQGKTDEEWESLKRDCWLLLQNKDYIILFFAFSIGVGFFNSIMTLLNQIVGPFGYSNDDAGTFGAVFIFCGLGGAGIAGKF
jgi:hypothetical protein